ncbi:MAG: YncE family protein, partial [Acidimicrobiales bacterium]
NTVSVIDGSTNAVTATVGVGRHPQAVAVDPAGDTAYVTNSDDNTVSVIDGSTNSVTATVDVGGNPEGLTVDPGTDTVYVTSNADNTVSVIDGSTNAVTATVAAGSAPVGVAVDPTAHTAYVADAGGNNVSVIAQRPAQQATITTLAVSATPTAGEPVTLTATVVPVPDGGTMTFTDNASPISACQSQPVNTTIGQATCTLTYTTATSHTITAGYSGDAAFTPSTATTTFTVTPGPLDHLVLSPATATIAVRGTQTYTAEGFDAYGNDVGDVTSATTFTIASRSDLGKGDPSKGDLGRIIQSCTASTCTATLPGMYTVTGSDGTPTGTASLTVSLPDKIVSRDEASLVLQGSG